MKTETLWATLLATLLMTFLFGVVMHIWSFTIIDEMRDPERIIAHIDAMTPAQRSVHAWMTGTLDVFYPLAYGAFFVGMALRFFGRFGPCLAIPGIAVIPTDLFEGVIQIMLLNGIDSVVWMKAYVTPLKFWLWIAAFVISVVAGGIASKRSYLANRKSRGEASD